MGFVSEGTKGKVYKSIFDNYIANLALLKIRVCEDELIDWCFNEIRKRAPLLPPETKIKRPAYEPCKTFDISSHANNLEVARLLLDDKWNCVNESKKEIGILHDLQVFEKMVKCTRFIVRANEEWYMQTSKTTTLLSSGCTIPLCLTQ